MNKWTIKKKVFTTEPTITPTAPIAIRVVIRIIIQPALPTRVVRLFVLHEQGSHRHRNTVTAPNDLAYYVRIVEVVVVPEAGLHIATTDIDLNCGVAKEPRVLHDNRDNIRSEQTDL